jgi:hypothetical protein
MILAVADADYDGVPLIPLNPFQVLYEESFKFAGIKKCG